MNPEPGGGGGADIETGPSGEPLAADGTAYAPSVAERLDVYQRAGGIITPVITALFAFFMGGLVVLATGHNPWKVYKGIFTGSGLNWFFHVGHHSITPPFSDTHVWFPWNTSIQSNSAYNLQQTLILTTTLILTGLAVAFAFRCGLFNIGGQGQYLVGAIVGVYVGSRFVAMAHVTHIVFAIAAAALAGALWGAIAGFLKATVGAHEVITTIMLNWIAYWVGSDLVGFGGPLQDKSGGGVNPQTPDIAKNAHLHVFWGDPVLQGLHIGFFVALAGLVVFWIVLNRTTLGYEVRAVGFNAEAAHYGGINVRRSYFTAMAIAGAFAGLAGAMDVLGWEFHVSTEVTSSQIGFFGIAVALLGRNSSVGIFFSSLLFAALLEGTSSRTLDPSVFQPELARNLTGIIQGLVVLFVGADVLVLYLWQARRKLGLKPRQAAAS